MFKRVRTPCIGVCSTGIGDNVCRGCKRFSHEVICWNAYTEDQRFMVSQRLELFLTQIVKTKLQVFDYKKLNTQLFAQKIRYEESQNAYCWVFALLKAGATQIDDPEGFGFRLLPQWQGHSLGQIRDDIDAEFFALSSAHYDRYIAPGLAAQETV